MASIYRSATRSRSMYPSDDALVLPVYSALVGRSSGTLREVTSTKYTTSVFAKLLEREHGSLDR